MRYEVQSALDALKMAMRQAEGFRDAVQHGIVALMVKLLRVGDLQRLEADSILEVLDTIGPEHLAAHLASKRNSRSFERFIRKLLWIGRESQAARKEIFHFPDATERAKRLLACLRQDVALAHLVSQLGSSSWRNFRRIGGAVRP